MVNKVHCAHILVEKLSLAQEIKTKIASGESFANLAKQHSIDSSKKRGGDLGFFGRGVMVQEFEKAAFALEKESSFRHSQDPVWLSYYKAVRLEESSLME